MAKTKLKDLEVTEVSLVDAGANQHAHVALYKRTVGDLIKRQWSLFVNGAVNQQGKLRA